MTEDIHLTFWGHVEELRATLIKVLSVIALGTLAVLFFFPAYFEWITSPLKDIREAESLPFAIEKVERIRVRNNSPSDQTYRLPERSALSPSSPEAFEISPFTYVVPSGGFLEYDRKVPAKKLIMLSPGEGLLATLKLSLWTGAAVTSPVWLYLILKFVAPALRKREKSLLFPFLAASLCSMAAGGALAFFATIPLANSYLAGINDSLGQNLWSLSHYIDYTVLLIFANALAFELSVVLLFLVHFGLISKEALSAYRRVAYVAIFILSALLTPPDVLTQFMLAIPLIGIYEGAFVYAASRNKKRCREAEIAKRSPTII